MAIRANAAMARLVISLERADFPAGRVIFAGAGVGTGAVADVTDAAAGKTDGAAGAAATATTGGTLGLVAAKIIIASELTAAPGIVAAVATTSGSSGSGAGWRASNSSRRRLHCARATSKRSSFRALRLS